MKIFSGTRSRLLGSAIARQLGISPGGCRIERFPDGELHVQLEEELAGAEVALVQSIAAPAGEELLELLLLADACWRAGARRLIAVIPYFAYARQDRRTEAGGTLGGPLIAQLVSTARFARVLGVDLHAEASEGWFGVPMEQLSALPLLAEAARPWLLPESIAVSPDLGGAKRAERVGRLLGVPLAVVQKTRRSGSAVEVHQVLGDVAGRAVILVDDLISTGGTIEAAVGALRAAKCLPEVLVLAPHALLAGEAVEKLRRCGITRLVTSDSLPPHAQLPFPTEVVCLARLLASALVRRPG